MELVCQIAKESTVTEVKIALNFKTDLKQMGSFSNILLPSCDVCTYIYTSGYSSNILWPFRKQFYVYTLYLFINFSELYNLVSSRNFESLFFMETEFIWELQTNTHRRDRWLRLRVPARPQLPSDIPHDRVLRR